MFDLRKSTTEQSPVQTVFSKFIALILGTHLLSLSLSGGIAEGLREKHKQFERRHKRDRIHLNSHMKQMVSSLRHFYPGNCHHRNVQHDGRLFRA